MRKLAKAKWISVLLLYTFAFGITNAEAGIRDRIRQRRTPQRASQKQTSKPTLPTVEGQQPQALSSGPQYPPPSVNSLRGTQNLPASNDGWVFTFDSSNGLWGPEAPGGGAGASDLDGLSDVVISSHTAGKYLRANGTNFVDANIALNDITGIAVVSQATGEVLRSNGTNFVDATLDFDDLANTTITSWSTGEVPRWNGSALVDSKLASTDLSDFAGTIVGNTGDILGWGGSAWDDLTMAVAITNAFGNGTDNQVLTSNGAGGVAWEDSAGGGGFAIKTPDGTTTVTRLSSYNPYEYGASGDYRYAKTSGSNSAAATTINMESGQEAYFKVGQSVAIRDAGATHALAAATPTAPTVQVAGQSEFYRNSGNVIEMLNYRKFGDFFGITSGYTFTADATANTITTALPLGVDDGHAIMVTNSGGSLPTLSGGGMSTGTPYFVHLVVGTTSTYTLHGSQADGISGANPKDITAVGSGTHSYWTEIGVKCYSTVCLPQTPEVQTVTVINSGGTPGGSFTLTLSGYGTTGAINWNASTSTTATNIQTALRAVTGMSSVTCTFASGDFTAGAIFTVTMVGVPGDVSQMTSADSMTGSSHSVAHATTTNGIVIPTDTQVFLRPDTNSLRRWTVHPTFADSANNANVYALTGPGVGFHSLQMYDGTTIDYRVMGWSSNGGKTVRSAVGSVTTAPATLRGKYGVNLYWPILSDGGGTPIYATAFDVYCNRNGSEHLLCKVGGSPTGYAITMQAGGYVNCVPSDIGKKVSYSGNFRGRLHNYDNPSRTWIIDRDYDSGDTFPSGSVCTIVTESASNSTLTNTSGVGAGTTTGTPTWVYICTDGGDKDVDYNNRSFARRTGKCVQIVKKSGTPTGGTFQVSLRGYTFNLPYNAAANDANPGDVDDFQDALKYYVPGCQNVTVTSVGSSPNDTYIVTFQDASPAGMGEVPTMHISNLMTGGTPVVSFGTVIQGADYNVGDVIVEPPTSAGLTYEVIAESGLRAGNLTTLTTTQNAITPDGRQLVWHRVDELSTVTSPTAATSDLYLGSVTGVDTVNHTITVSPAITTTIPDDTPVWHNDLPGIQAAAAAIEASSAGGVMEFPTGYYNAWARDTSKSEWVDRISAFQSDCLIRLGSQLKSYNWRGNDSTIRFRFTDLSISSNSIGTTGDLTGGSQNPPPTDGNDLASGFVLDLFKCSDFNAEHLKLYLIGMADFEQDTYQNEGYHVWGGVSDDVTDTQKNRRSVKFKDVTWGGFRGIGTLASSYGPDAQAYFDNCTLYYGHTAHNSGAGEGMWNLGKIERIGRLGSTAWYGAEGYSVKQGFHGTRILNAGVDGIRIRSAGFEWIGGSMIDTKYDENSTENLVSAMLIEPRARGTKVIGVQFNLHSGIKCQADNCTFDANDLRNASISLDSASPCNYCVISGNTGTANDWVRNSNGTFITVAGGVGHQVYGNTFNSETTDTSSSAANQNDGRRMMSGIDISGATTTHLQIGPNTMVASNNALNISSSFVGDMSVTGGYYYSTDYEYNSGNESSILAAGNGAIVTLNGVTFDALTKSDEVNVGVGASSARYIFDACTMNVEVEIAAALTTPVTLKNCNAIEGTQGWDFLDDNTIIENTNFAATPTLTGASLFTKGNRVANSSSVSAGPFAASINDAAIPVCDNWIITLTGNQDFTGAVARADGSEIVICNGDAADTLTVKNLVTSAATNQIRTPGGTNLVVGPNGVFKLRRINSIWYAFAQ